MKPVCTFYLDGSLWGLDLGEIQEVIRSHPMTPVPGGPAVLQGLINLRGNIVTAIDLRRRLALPERQAGQAPMNVVVHAPGGVVSLLVDHIGDVLNVDESAFEPAPETLTGGARELIRGVYKLKERLLIMLDLDKTLTWEGNHV